MLKPPQHINDLTIRGSAVQFNLSEDVLEDAVANKFRKLRPIVYRLGDRAKIAVTASLVEWIVWRMDGLVDITDMLDFCEGMWAIAIDYRYTKQIEHCSVREGLEGVLYFTWLEGNAVQLQSLDDLGTADSFEALVGLTRHVLPKSKHKLFGAWLKPCLDRLAEYCTLDDPEAFEQPARSGPPVPRMLFDLEFDFTPNLNDELCSEFLSGLDPKQNRYLRSPAELRKLGMKQPYRL